MGIRVREEEHFSLEMTPLIDVVFLLLVFFLVATTFHQLEREMQISVPSSETGEGSTKGPEPVVVNLLADGKIVVEGNAVSIEQLRSLLQRRAERSESLKALIRADKKISVESLVAVADACRKAKAIISLATIEKGS